MRVWYETDYEYGYRVKFVNGIPISFVKVEV